MRKCKRATMYSGRAGVVAVLNLAGALLLPTVGQSRQAQPPQISRQPASSTKPQTAGRGTAGTNAVKREGTIDAAMRGQVIRTVLKRLNELYVFPETARQMEVAVLKRAANGEYDGLTDGQAFADKLTSDLRAVCRDKHLSLRYSAQSVPEDAGKRKAPSPDERARMQRMGAAINWGFERVERLSGNIGYLELRGFAPPDMAGETAAAAMNFLAGTDALIIDLRRNGGGEPGMVALLCSYFLDENGEGVHLNDIYWRPDNSTRQYWTLPHLAGKHYGQSRPLYLLTAEQTFSAAEEFAYNLKNLKRAVLVGETTGGGANPGEDIRVSEHFLMYLPMGRAINPLTKTNWEGTGIAPDIAVTSSQALQAARTAALRLLASHAADPNRKAALQQGMWK